MAEKLALKKALFDELKKTNQKITDCENIIELTQLKHHKDFIQHLIDICVDRNKF